MIIYDEWNDSFRIIMQHKGIVHLFLNYSLGWKCSDYTFLECLPLLNTLEIIDIHSKGIKSIEKQYKLVTLSLNIPNGYGINYKVFSDLKSVFCYGKKYNASLFSCKSIENLYIDELKIGDKHAINQLINLRELTIANSNITSLSFLRNLKYLNSLAIINCKRIQSFIDISELNNLLKLDIRGVNNLHDINFVSWLHNIEIIIIETDFLNSIRPLTNLANLKALALLGRNFIIEDKDLTPIECLKKLSILNIPNRNCYSMKINNYWNWNDYGKSRNSWLTRLSSS